MKLLLAIFIVVLQVSESWQENCLSKSFGELKTVCVCNSNHCDVLKPIKKTKASKFLKITSNEAGIRYKEEEGEFEKSNSKSKNLIEIGKETYQKIFGFGGAFTDSTGINIKSLNENLGNEIIKAYFSNDGLEYNIGRVPMGGTDFSLRPYTYDDTQNNTADPTLKKFKLQPEDIQYKIPYIKKAAVASNSNLKLFASAWIAPDWIRTIPGATARKSFIKDDMYQTWANYFVKFLDAYKKNNLPFWGITTGNEPGTAFVNNVTIPSIAWLPEGMSKFIKENLGPTLKKSYPGVKLLALDDQTIYLPKVIKEFQENKQLEKYVDGIATHWYLDTNSTTEYLDQTHKSLPKKFILSTEACNGFLTNDVILGSWERGEKYADTILKYFNHWVTGWLDWNMVLNIQGGPTFINNFVDAPILVNATGNEFYKQPMYYTLAHFSKTIPRGSVRIQSTALKDTIPSVALKRPDGGTTIIILNKENAENMVTIRDPKKGDIKVTLSSKSITSIVYW